MDTPTKAKKAAVLKMMHAFPSSQDRITADVLAAYLDAVSEIGAEAVERSCTQFSRGLVDGRNNAFMPTAAELSANARQWQDAIAQVEASRAIEKAGRLVSYPIGTLPPPPSQPLGPIKMEVGGIMRDTSDWTFEEKDFALRTGSMPATRDALRNPAITADKTPKPRIRGMTEK